MDSKKLVILYFIVIFIVATIGCASNKSSEGGRGEPANIPTESRFSKLKLRMGEKQVHDLIGKPNDTVVRTTGKQYIPYYLGGDYTRVIEYYKGEGRIYFGKGILLLIEYDPTEDGYQ